MNLEEVQKAIREGKAEFIKQPEQSELSEQPSQKQPEDYAKFIAILEVLRRPKYHLTEAPDFAPKNFLEQIQFVDDGDLKVYFYINNQWGYITLTT